MTNTRNRIQVWIKSLIDANPGSFPIVGKRNTVDLNMRPEPDYLIPDFLLKAGNNGQRNDHYRNANGNSCDGDRHDWTAHAATFAARTANAFGYEIFGVQEFSCTMRNTTKIGLLFLALLFLSTLNAQVEVVKKVGFDNDRITVGAARTALYLPLLEGKRVAVVANQTSVFNGAHLVDVLIAKKVDLKKVFAPEHGFRGQADAGEVLEDGRDRKTGIPVISLYGKNKKPSATQLADVDVVLFDIQDVGARFYTYISTMHYVMEACVEQGKSFIVLDRPNPNGFYVDGPILEEAQKSFVGMHPVPIVHGMTVGEYAHMINGEGWLDGALTCDLTVITCTGYDHNSNYELPIAPSPNLPNMSAIFMYPTLCLFEGTIVSVGRGTAKQFQIIGFPSLDSGSFRFTPKPMPGAKQPKYKGEECRGFDLSTFGEFYMRNTKRIYLFWIINIYEDLDDAQKADFFIPFFDKLAGTTSLRAQIEAGRSVEEIQASWQEGIEAFKITRSRYLLYKDFK